MESLVLGDFLKEFMWQLDQNASTVTSICFGSSGSAVIQIVENLQGLGYNAVFAFALDADNKADATSVVFKFGTIKAILELLGIHDSLSFKYTGLQI